MMPTWKRTWAERLGLALIVLVFAVNVYRAAVQSCTVDEATTYNEYASKSVTEILTLPYDANNQVLHTILCRWFVRVFGVSELTLRMASLLGGLLFLTMSYRLCRLYFGRGWLFLAVFALLVLNPFTLDYLSVARGYGLAAGLLLVACDQLSRHVLEPEWDARRLTRASFALGMSVAANLTFAVPAVAVVLTFLHLEFWELRRLRLWEAVNSLILPGTIAAAVILLLPLIRASRDAFYFGASSLRDAVESMAFPALFHHRTVLYGLGQWIGGEALWLLGILGSLILLGMVAASRGGRDSLARRMPLLFMGGTLGVSCAILCTAHVAGGLLYPVARTGLYLVVLFTLSAGALFGWLGENGRGVGVVIAVPILMLFAAQITVGPYNAWVFDSGTKRIVNLIREDVARGHVHKVRIGAGHVLIPSLNFYRRRFHMNGVTRVEEGSLEHAADYYVLLPQETGLVGKQQLEVMYRDGTSLQVLAKHKVLH